MQFTKWNGCGNDFVFVNAMNMDIQPVVDRCREICDRHFGIGADGIIFVLPSNCADLRMRIFNSDGSEAEMCGNGIRCFALFARELGLVKGNRFTVETGAGILVPEILSDRMVRVDMGAPHLNAPDIPVIGFGEGTVINAPLHVASNDREYRITCVSMGNPHAVIFTDDVPDDDTLCMFGSQIEKDPHFPNRTNVEFAHVEKDGSIRMRVWERGTGITMACGTGSCATVVAAMLNGVIDGNETDVHVDGGTLHIAWEGGDSHVFMTGPADKVFTGEYSLED
jgi:diaminopimelate epimerase